MVFSKCSETRFGDAGSGWGKMNQSDIEYAIGHLILQPNRQLLHDGLRLPLGSKALALISALAERNGELVTKDELMETVWPSVIVEENVIQVHVAALRKLLGPAAEKLVTVRGIGYRLDAAPAPRRQQLATISQSPALQQSAHSHHVLAVLPFENLSSDHELTYFCDGVSEEILGRIARRTTITVIGRTSSFQFRAEYKANAAAILNATHILDGSIQRAGGRIRVSAHLVDCTTNTSLWSQHFDRNIEDIFAVQDEIAEAIAEALKSNLAAATSSPVDPATYDLYLRAKERVTSQDAIARNVESLEHITRAAAGFAPGWATLAYRRAELMMHCPYQLRAELKAKIENDLSVCDLLDPSHPDALAARWVLMPPFGSLAQQAAIFNTNTVPNLDQVDFLTAQAYFLECVGRSGDAAEQSGRAARLDPLNPFAVGLHSQALWFAGHTSEAIAAMEYVRQRWPDSHHTAAVLIQAYTHQQNWGAVDRLIDPSHLKLYPLREHTGVIAYARVMRNPTLRNRQLMFNTIRERAEATGHLDAQVAVIAAELGFVDETFALLERCRFGPSGTARDVMGTHAYRTLLLFPKAYTALRNDPRFVKICARLGLVDYWLETQNWPDCTDWVPYDFKSMCEDARGQSTDVFALPASVSSAPLLDA